MKRVKLIKELNLTSKTKEIRRFKIYSRYRSAIGGVIYEDKIDKQNNCMVDWFLKKIIKLKRKRERESKKKSITNINNIKCCLL